MSWQLTGDPVIKHIGGKWFETVEPLRVEWNGLTVKVPVGFKTDLATIPRFAHMAYPVIDDHIAPAIVHDYVYIHHTEMGRREADRMFLEGMYYMRVGWFKRTTMYLAVRCFGWMYWNY